MKVAGPRFIEPVRRVMPLGVLALAAVAVGLRLVGALFADTVTTKTPALKYHQELGMRYNARIGPTPLYASPILEPDDLPRWQVQADPPAYRRSILLPPLEKLYLYFPYKVEFDRPAQITGTVTAKGYLAAPRLWQQSIELGTPLNFRTDGPRADGTYQLNLDLKAYSTQLVQAFQEGGMAPGSGEIWIDVSLAWQASEVQGTPVRGSLPAVRYIIGLFPGHIEIEEHDPSRQDQTIYVPAEQPNVITLPFGWVAVHKWKAVTGTAAGALALPAVWAGWVVLRRREQPVKDAKLRRMPRVVEAQTMELAWVLEIRVKSEDDLLRIHATTGQPVLHTARGYHVVAEQVCYTLETMPE